MIFIIKFHEHFVLYHILMRMAFHVAAMFNLLQQHCPLLEQRLKYRRKLTNKSLRMWLEWQLRQPQVVENLTKSYQEKNLPSTLGNIGRFELGGL